MAKIKQKLSKEQKSLLIALLIGDGTISNNNVFKLSHSIDQQEYLEWKIKLLNNLDLKNNGLKYYTSTCGYNKGKKVVYSQLSINPTIKSLRRILYKPKKIIIKQLLNYLNPLGLAIWYMDDGHININTSIQRSSIQHTIKISTCVDNETIKIIIKYFKDRWNINFRPFKERENMFSLASSSEIDYYKFINIVKPYVSQVPSLLYKIRNNYTKKEFIAQQTCCFKTQNV